MKLFCIQSPDLGNYMPRMGKEIFEVMLNQSSRPLGSTSTFQVKFGDTITSWNLAAIVLVR